MQTDIEHLANSCDVDPLTVERAAHAVCRRLIEWHRETPIDASQELIEAALDDYTKAMRSMALSIHMRPTAFNATVYELLRR